MGTTYHVKVVGTPAQIDAEAIRRTIDEVLATIDLEMSQYRPDSAIARFNASRSTDWIEVPRGLAQVVELAHRVSERSAGAFDVTIAPLVDAWGFGADGEPTSLPTQTRIAELRERTGYRRLHVRLLPSALRKEVDTLTIDVNGVAPGYAVDVLASYFNAMGLRDFMIDIGGEVLARGHNASGAPWRIAVERPQDGDPSPFVVVDLSDRSITTSGEYRHYFERDGRRYSHTIDPRSGYPIESYGSVAVVGATSLEIDAWATALNVLGPIDGLAMANKNGIAAMFIVVENGKLVAHKSKMFERTVQVHAPRAPG
jgi:thiamine biosynthesis lipoprotein